MTRLHSISDCRSGLITGESKNFSRTDHQQHTETETEISVFSFSPVTVKDGSGQNIAHSFLLCPFLCPDHQKKTLRRSETIAETRGRLPAGSPKSCLFRSVIRSVLCFSGLSGDRIRTKYLKLCISYSAYNMTGLLAIICYHEQRNLLK